jgi:hypothetical protein
VKPQDELSLFSQSDPSHFRHEISGRFVAANFGNFMMYAAASFSVTSVLPFGGLIGSSKRRDHGNGYLLCVVKGDSTRSLATITALAPKKHPATNARNSPCRARASRRARTRTDC